MPSGRFTADRLASVLPWVAVATVAIYVLKFGVSRTDPIAELAVPLRPLWLDVVLGVALGSIVGGAPQIRRRPWLATGAVAVLMAGVAWIVALPAHQLLGFDPVTERGFELTGALSAAAGVGFSRLRGRMPGILELLVFEVLAASILTDLVIAQSKAIRDLDLYLLAGRHFLDGAPVYLGAPLTRLPVDPVQLPFLYPPVTLPVFALLASLPHLLVATVWEVACVAAGAAGMRLLGVRWRWMVAILLCPPFFQGIYVGNVVLFGFLLLCLAPRVGGGLVLGPVLKVQYGIAALWLVRERRWHAIVAGGATLAVLVMITLPIVGVGEWGKWWVGLEALRQTQVLLPKTYFQALPRYIPYAAYVVISVIAAVAAFLGHGRTGLAHLGVATIVSSPTVFDHGFTFALPALLGLTVPLVWLGLGLLTIQGGLGGWGTALLAFLATASPALCQTPSSTEEMHPLGPGQVAWGAGLSDASAP